MMLLRSFTIRPFLITNRDTVRLSPYPTFLLGVHLGVGRAAEGFRELLAVGERPEDPEPLRSVLVIPDLVLGVVVRVTSTPGQSIAWGGASAGET